MKISFYGDTLVIQIANMPQIMLDQGLWIGVLLLILGSLALTAWVTLRAYRLKASTGAESLVGDKAEIIEWSGVTGRIRTQGEEWRAYADQPLELKAGEIVTIAGIEDLKLKIKT